MRDIEKYIENLNIVNIKKGLTKENAEMFDFPDSQYRFLNKRSMIILCAEAVLFVIWYKMQAAYSGSVLFYVLTLVLAFVAFAYQYETRNVRYYKKARKGARSNALGYCLKYTNKIVNSSAVYLTEMPLVYFLLKAESLLRQRRVIECGVLMEKALEAYTQNAHLSYFLGLCAYAQRDDERAKEQMLAVCKGGNASSRVIKNAGKILNELKPKLI